MLLMSFLLIYVTLFVCIVQTIQIKLFLQSIDIAPDLPHTSLPVQDTVAQGNMQRKSRSQSLLNS